jgi:hypothetical protein
MAKKINSLGYIPREDAAILFSNLFVFSALKDPG